MASRKTGPPEKKPLTKDKRQSSNPASPSDPRPKKKTRSKSSLTLEDHIQLALRAPGERGREARVKIYQRIHSADMEKVLAIHNIQREIESNDPKSLEEAVIRAIGDVNSLFNSNDIDVLEKLLLGGAPTAEEPVEFMKDEGTAKVEWTNTWISRWIEPPEAKTEQPPRDRRDKLIGFLGEYLVFRLFYDLLPDFMESNWTSSLRQHAFPELETPKDKEYCSDFTYVDTNGTLAAILKLSPETPRIFFLEVKSSRENEDGFAFSSRQFKIMQEAFFEWDVDRVYVILKVVNLIEVRKARIARVIENPLRLFWDRELELRSDGLMRASWNC